MARTRSSSSIRWRYLNPVYYLKRPTRLALLFIAFVFVSFIVWDRQTLVREHEIRVDGAFILWNVMELKFALCNVFSS
ncbi:putative mannosyl-oligosaccharide 1,2-alpha-mannosidase [Helianthus annuus]|nr:putative mannosyl-oligosaccharide 1,2-alpha-mannosidase [Helianthus annuus]